MQEISNGHKSNLHVNKEKLYNGSHLDIGVTEFAANPHNDLYPYFPHLKATYIHRKTCVKHTSQEAIERKEKNPET